MTHLIGLQGSRGRVRSLAGIAIGLSLLFLTAFESTHTHTESDLSAVCSVCEFGHQGVQTATADGPAVVEPGEVRTPALPGSRLTTGIVHLSPHRSRAPPPSISL